MNKKLFFNIILYLSLIFLVVFLYKYDFFDLKNIKLNYLYLSISVLFLWTGFFMSALSWWNVLKKHKILISKKKAVVSHGLVIFAKYIPGKVWMILGRAAKAVGTEYSVKTASFVSLKEQLLFIWSGLLISAVPLFVYRGLDVFSVSVSVLFFGITIFIFFDKVRILIIWLVKKVFKKELEIPHISFKESINILSYIFLYWSAWIIAFYFLSLSIYPDTSLEIGFIFPLSATLGLLAVIVPGGIGVREGIMTAFMVLSGIPLEISTTISVISRLWFISGEFFIFVLALSLKKFKN
ncbi:MAG: flippase-like domain-containing protein [Bacteroidales bacterium]|nr:flippase-like domain-containing protein [Bacteroidales bacterium]